MSNESGQYQLSVLLKLSDRLSGGLSSKTIPTLRKFKTESKSALDQYTKLQRALGKSLLTSGVDKYMGKMKAATKETRAFGTEQGKLSRRFDKSISTKGLDAQIGKLKEYRRTLRSTSTASDSFRTSMRARMPGGRGVNDPLDPYASRANRGGRRRGRPYGFAQRMGDAGDFMMATQQVGNVWRDKVASLEKYTDAATRLIRSEARLKACGVDGRSTQYELSGNQ